MLTPNLDNVLSELPSLFLAESNPSIPQLLSHSHVESEIHLSLYVDPDMPCFRGHFPGNPVLPGVVQLQWAIELARATFDIATLPRNILRLKFKSIVVPPGKIRLVLVQRAAHDIGFTYFDREATCSQGLLRFDGRVQ